MDICVLVSLLLGGSAGLAVAVFVTPVFCFLRKLFFVPLMRKRFKEQAIRKGHVVQATLEKSHAVVERRGSFGLYRTGEKVNRYLYEYNGKQYKFYGTGHLQPEQELTLYFLKNPRKATLETALGLKESNWALYYIVLSIVIGIAAFFVLYPEVKEIMDRVSRGIGMLV